ncbi:response regulator [Singulisphaera acidiphila]|uniref:Response regulator with CheY-like receiver domain and winged-helix DNA-binding domain n=1 Tax=Singulisphaera acidiphila (strain ATCC BAA-1392 / DSM 18658 / VKM B-2454 / MOB10) TaxID=886293 RepID=L0D5Q0_SINAD|nr:response regulator [Singulisphaera acidiphila]AGA24587.1 response regulator with CheY-like receiver domain and winged-helix DNA-binding domain [Singulisphaera acidiphila DSM 18658]
MVAAEGHVLIVEDSLAMGYALRAQFQAFGWEVTLSRTVASALENLDPPPDWILLDLWLSDGDGQDVLRYVREVGIPSHVAVISAGLDPERVASLEPLRPDLMIPKPISFEKLLEACQSTHSASRSEPSSASSSPL